MSPAATLQQISENRRGERGRRAAIGGLVLRVVETTLASGEGAAFLRARALVELAGMGASAEQAMLGRLLLLLEETSAASDGRLGESLVWYGCTLESTHRIPEADAVMRLARSVAPRDAEIALHAGRVARKFGERERALELYRAARELDGAGGAIARLASIGAAVVSAEPEAGLGRAIRRAVAAGDSEAAAVGLEERARLRRVEGRFRAGGRDLCLAALRFTDPVDRARVAHELADLCFAARDPLAAGEALRLALALGDGPQREHARSRLHTLCRDLGDQVGMRRWRSFQRPSLVSLSAYARTAAASFAPALARWREHLECVAPARA